MRPMLTGWLVLVGLAAATEAGDVAFQREGSTLEITVNGRPFTTYRFGSDLSRPYFWPILGPGGGAVTRAYPNSLDAPDETQDHPWHRGLSFTHGAVGLAGQPPVDFWREGAPRQGRIVHRGFDPEPQVEAGVLRFGVRNDWFGPDGVVLVQEHTRWQVRDLDDESTRLAVQIELRTGGSTPVVLGDTEEGSFSVRVATSMDEKAEATGPRASKPRGQVVNSEGRTTAKECWGQIAPWVDYSGPVAGQTLGLAIFDHPANPRNARWHVRDYGLFSANPFGWKEFLEGTTKRPTEPRPITLAPDRPLTLRYAVLVHRGSAEAAGVARRFAEYTKESTSP